MTTARLRAIKLTAFKSFRDEVLPVDDVTVLTGRNSSGKSNALDGIEVLSRLAGGEELADALDGRRREGGPVRGGSAACAPHGTTSFKLGCTVALGVDIYRMDVHVQVKPELRILEETLTGPAPALESGVVEERVLLATRPAETDDAVLHGEIFNGKRGSNPVLLFRDNRLLTSQIPLRVIAENRTDRAVIRGAEAVMAALRGVFHLDPIPHLMRGFIPERDSDLRRTGENISAALQKLRRSDGTTFERITQLVREVADERIRDLTTVKSDLGDVMLALREGQQKSDISPAREMSDGLLRFIAIATALLTSNRGLDIDAAGLSSHRRRIDPGVLLVIEELENGLHPSQASRVLGLIQEASRELETKVMVTTHSPALLNAMTGRLNRSVIVCYRDREDGKSHLTRLPDLPGYAQAMALGDLGDVIARGHLVAPEEASSDYSEFNRLLGID
ncbi:putative ATPase [Kribbella aluminosa]|uniref:ATPase n=1 Tax=Kribbella aluminosa TaxID=416017 RepID=A0ABS4UJE0_9ACTN|nr:ATP-binding protein [Kribbella aluminosa]MBP2351734.1 putative ATPase [Kribbella aluminosa]